MLLSLGVGGKIPGLLNSTASHVSYTSCSPKTEEHMVHFKTYTTFSLQIKGWILHHTAVSDSYSNQISQRSESGRCVIWFILSVRTLDWYDKYNLHYPVIFPNISHYTAQGAILSRQGVMVPAVNTETLWVRLNHTHFDFASFLLVAADWAVSQPTSKAAYLKLLITASTCFHTQRHFCHTTPLVKDRIATVGFKSCATSLFLFCNVSCEDNTKLSRPLASPF